MARRDSLVLVVVGSIDPLELEGLCDRVRVLLEASKARRVVCDVSLVRWDAVTVDALARLGWVARRLGMRLELRDPGPELRGLIALMGLRDVVPLSRDGDPAGPASRTAGTDEACRGRS